MNNKEPSTFSPVGALLSIFFSLIIAYVIFGIFDAPKFDDFGYICCFVVFNIVALVSLSTFGGAISKACGLPTLSACWVSAVVYSIIQFASTFTYLARASSDEGNKFYVLGNLILAFILLTVTLPIISFGARREKNK